MNRIGLILPAICAPLLGGCGTFADAFAGPIDDRLYYRGVCLDVSCIKNGMPIMVVDLPFSACADTLLVPSIAYQQLTDPEATHKSVMHCVGEELGKSVVNDVVVPATADMARSLDAEMRKQQSASSPLVGTPADR